MSTSGRDEASTKDEAPWRRLSRRMLLVHPVQETIRNTPALVGLLFAGFSRGDQGGRLWGLAGLALTLVLGTLRWFTTTYRVTPQYVQVRKGLLRRQVLTAPRDRIRTVDATSHMLHRLLGLARVEIGTGRTDTKRGGALRLDALRADEVARLREELLHRPPADAASAEGSQGTIPAGPPDGRDLTGGRETGTREVPRLRRPAAETELAALHPAWIRYGPFTMSGLITAGVLAGFLSRIANEGNVDLLQVGPVRQVVDRLGQEALWAQVTAVVAMLAVFVAVASTLGYVLAFWRFRLTRTAGGTLHVTRGLITTRATTLEERRLRGIEVSEPLPLRVAGGARLIAVATGLRVGRGAQRGGSMLLPPAPRAEAVAVAGRVIGTAGPLAVELTPHGPAALRRRFTRALAVCLPVTAALAALWEWDGWPAWAWQLALLGTVATVPLAADRYRALGHALTPGHLVTRWGTLVRRRVALDLDGVIGWNIRRSFFQRRAGLATLTATTAAGRQGYGVWDVELGEALRLADQGIPGLLTPFLQEDAAAPGGAEAASPPARR
ncbi:PH domain-containing protein [Sphaerisporangium sp. NPDC005288]|uniref:PH domain-containing protein n=1 Tax=Sphaerisporangium sp. NPDC005288 TaxID=3155114 RepID=UPI00339FAC14